MLTLADGQRALSGSADRTLRLWAVDTGDTLATLHLDAAVTCFAVADHDRVVVGDVLGRMSKQQRRRQDKREALDHASRLAFVFSQIGKIVLQGCDGGIEDAIGSLGDIKLVEQCGNAIRLARH